MCRWRLDTCRSSSRPCCSSSERNASRWLAEMARARRRCCAFWVASSSRTPDRSGWRRACAWRGSNRTFRYRPIARSSTSSPTGLGDVSDLLTRYHHTVVRLAEEGTADLLEKLGSLQHELEERDGWRIEQRVELVLSHLDLPPDAVVDTLSGGWSRRVLLARALVAGAGTCCCSTSRPITST